MRGKLGIQHDDMLDLVREDSRARGLVLWSIPGCGFVVEFGKDGNQGRTEMLQGADDLSDRVGRRKNIGSRMGWRDERFMRLIVQNGFGKALKFAYSQE